MAKHTGTILVCDDDSGLLSLIRDILEGEGHAIDLAQTGRQALSHLEGRTYDLFLSDMMLPDANGLNLLAEVKRRWPDTEVIIITGHGDIDSAVQAIKQGAYDYITKPFHHAKFAIDVHKAIERRRLSQDLERLSRRTESREALGALVGRSEPMQALFRQIEQVAQAQTAIMILGESGTGKEVAARAIHAHSPRSGGPFVAVSCSTIPASLLEAELFGHVRGAFTGAASSRAGLFEAAEGGTIFLDEIGVAPPQAQIGLLRVLQDKEVRRVGATESRKVDVRVISATNVDLEKAIDEGTFRSDLYYRLAGVTLQIPPLRQRAEDIPLLASRFLARFGESLSRPARSLSPRALELLCGHHWPGNVRELEHVMEHAAIFAEREVVRPRDLPDSIQPDRQGREGLAPGSLEDIERDHIRLVLRHTSGNKLKAARLLGIPRASLYRRIQKYGLEPAPKGRSGRGAEATGSQILALDD